MQIAVYGRSGARVNEVLAIIRRFCSNNSMPLYVNDAIAQPTDLIYHEGGDDLPQEIDYLISLGGDGTFLNAVLQVRARKTILFGVNLGRLGFLAPIGESEIEQYLHKLIEGNSFPILERGLIKVDGTDAFGDFPYALNDAVIQKGGNGLLTIQVYENNTYLNTYQADGIIIATDTGSSAYSLSVGGPLIPPGSGNFVLSAIAAHNLNVRPLVLPDTTELQINVQCRYEDQNFTLSLDSRGVELPHNTTLLIRKGEFGIRTLQTHSYYSLLREKLLWGVDGRDKRP